IGNGHSIVGTAGLELDSWTRRIHGSTNVEFENEPEGFDGTVPGYAEQYFLLGFRLGVGMGHQLGGWEADWRAGLRYPFYIDEYVDLNNVALEPKGETSPLFELVVRPAKGSLAVSLYYETHRFGDSDPVAVPGTETLVKQPRSESSRAGVTLRYRFR
ncbi:MAG: hypothetical protein R6U87_07785, partial [Thiohalospira sp.]